MDKMEKNRMNGQMKGETDKQRKAATKKKDDLDTKPFLFGLSK